jgi:hypothetical protein
MIGVVVVGRDRVRRLGFGERGLETHDCRGTFVGAIVSGECQQATDIRLILGAQCLHARLGTDVVLTVGEAESALQQEHRVDPVAVDTGFDGQPDES